MTKEKKKNCKNTEQGKKWEKPELKDIKIEEPPVWSSCTSGSSGSEKDTCSSGS